MSDRSPAAAAGEAKSVSGIRFIAVTGVLSACAFVLQLLEFPIPLIPSFIKMDFSDFPALLGAFSLGPVCGILIELLKNLIHCMFSQSFGIGEISNFLLGATFTGVAGLIYRFNRTKKGAILSSLAGAGSMVVLSLFFNYFIVYPVYYNFMPMETILAAYQVIFSGVQSIWQCLLIFNLPFTLVKGLIVVLITYFTYKPLSPLLKGRLKS